VIRPGNVQPLNYRLAGHRSAHVLVAYGKAHVFGEALSAGAAMAIEGHSEVQPRGVTDAELLIFDLP
jgi:hypothetical protein